MDRFWFAMSTPMDWGISKVLEKFIIVFSILQFCFINSFSLTVKR